MSSDLFDFAENNLAPGHQNRAPLAYKMRPRTLDEFVGQEKVLGPGKPLRQWITSDRVPSLILWGPPGVGKTTLAQIISRETQSHFQTLSAVQSGIKEIREAAESAKQYRRMSSRRTILFVDEIHRFNKSQQDALLPFVEDGTLILIGATTENPSFELNTALLSRTRVVRFERLGVEPLEKLLKLALEDKERGLAALFQMDDEAIAWLAATSEGDARRALTALENVSLSASGRRMSLEATQKALESAMERQPLPYDKRGEEHYNVISAFIKSIRDSDPHAGLYYLARMLEAGEDPLFICRRMVILASEDIGNADPRALQVAIAVKDAVEFVGMPEARINLAQGVTYLAVAPKSNASYEGVGEALAAVREHGALPVPMHLRNAVTGLMKSEGYGASYKYAHHQKGQRSKQSHLPEALLGTHFYRPKEVGLEKQIKEKLDLLNPDFNSSQLKET